jgi:hypothetical protein
VNVFSLSQTPQYTPGFPVVSPPTIRLVCSTRYVCNNTVKKPHWLIRNRVFSVVWDRAIGVFFDVRKWLFKR